MCRSLHICKYGAATLTASLNAKTAIIIRNAFFVLENTITGILSLFN